MLTQLLPMLQDASSISVDYSSKGELGTGGTLVVLASLGMAKNFGKSAGFGIGLWLLGPIFLLILAFGDAKYQGNQG